MRAAVRDAFGPPDVVRVVEIEKPAPAAGEVLVRVHAASLNVADWYSVAGRPLVGRLAMGWRRPKERRLGVDFAGTVEATGADVTHVAAGDDVFGGRTGALAEYVCVKNAVVRKPANLTFEQAAAVPVAAITALQAVRDKASVRPGEQVLVNGSSGGVGTFAVQVAKAFGAHVTAVCSPGNVEAARELGADEVVDYTREDFTRSGHHYDVVLDVAGSRSWRELRRVLTPAARVVVIGAPRGTRVLGPLSHVIGMQLSALFSRRKVRFFVAKLTREDLGVLSDLLASGNVIPQVDRTYELDDVASAFRYLGEGHCRSKIVVTP